MNKLLSHPYLQSMLPPYRRPLHLSAPLPIGINPYDVIMQLAVAHGELRSVKALVAFNIITRLIEAGTLYPGCTAIDATSGGTGLEYAPILQALGINLILVVQGSMPPGKLAPLRFYGEGVQIITHSGKESTVQRARREAKEFGYVPLDQYASNANPEAHELYTAPALWELTGGDIAAVIVALGTCGTALGNRRFLKRHNKDIQILGVAVDPDTTDGKVPQIPGMRTPEQIENDVRLPVKEATDEIRLVGRSSAVRGARRLAYVEPSGAGMSTGALLDPALDYVKENLHWLTGKRVIIYSADSSAPYLDIMNAEQDDDDIAQALSRRPAF